MCKSHICLGHSDPTIEKIDQHCFVTSGSGRRSMTLSLAICNEPTGDTKQLGRSSKKNLEGFRVAACQLTTANRAAMPKQLADKA